MTTSAPAHCSNCQAELDPNWKFCIKCGTPVPEVRPIPVPQQIPSAIRPDTDREPLRRRVDVPLLISITLGVAGAVLIVYLLVVIFGSHG